MYSHIFTHSARAPKDKRYAVCWPTQDPRAARPGAELQTSTFINTQIENAHTRTHTHTPTHAGTQNPTMTSYLAPMTDMRVSETESGAGGRGSRIVHGHTGSLGQHDSGGGGGEAHGSAQSESCTGGLSSYTMGSPHSVSWKRSCWLA